MNIAIGQTLTVISEVSPYLRYADKAGQQGIVIGFECNGTLYRMLFTDGTEASICDFDFVELAPIED